MSWMQPNLSLSLEASLRAAQLQLRRLPRQELIARAEHFMNVAAMNHHLLGQAQRRIAELELQQASQVAEPGERQLVTNDLLKRPRWPWNR
jgi:hypothetical protein